MKSGIATSTIVLSLWEKKEEEVAVVLYTTIGTKCRHSHVKVCHLASKKHHSYCSKLHMIYMSQKQFCSLNIPKIFLESMPPNPSSCMAHLQMHYEPDHSKHDGSVLLCVVLETEMFTFFCR